MERIQLRFGAGGSPRRPERALSVSNLKIGAGGTIFEAKGRSTLYLGKSLSMSLQHAAPCGEGPPVVVAA